MEEQGKNISKERCNAWLCHAKPRSEVTSFLNRLQPGGWYRYLTAKMLSLNSTLLFQSGKVLPSQINPLME